MALSRDRERDRRIGDDSERMVGGEPSAHPGWALALLGLGYAGYVKGLPALASLRVDLTGLFAALVAIGVLVALGRRRLVGGVLPGLVGLWLVFVIGAVSALWQPAGVYKTVLLYTVTLLCAVAPAALLGSERSRRWLVGATVLAGLAMASLLLINPSREAEAVFGRLTLEGSNSIGTARVVGAGAVAAVIMAVLGRRHRLLWLGAAVGTSVTLVLVGSRGPFVALVLALIVALVAGRAGPGFRRIRASLLGLTVVVALLTFVINSDNRAADRIAGLLTGSTTDSIRLALLGTPPERRGAPARHRLGRLRHGGHRRIPAGSVRLSAQPRRRKTFRRRRLGRLSSRSSSLSGSAFYGRGSVSWIMGGDTVFAVGGLLATGRADLAGDIERQPDGRG